jgi:hypothetical protein
MGKLEVAVAGKLLLPFAERVQDVTEARVDHPYEDQTITKIVFIKPACAVIRNTATGEIYACAK